jgi:hypothetical protein
MDWACGGADGADGDALAWWIVGGGTVPTKGLVRVWPGNSGPRQWRFRRRGAGPAAAGRAACKAAGGRAECNTS